MKIRAVFGGKQGRLRSMIAAEPLFIGEQIQIFFREYSIPRSSHKNALSGCFSSKA